MSSDTIGPDAVVGIEYRLTVTDGTEVDSTEGRGPLHYLHGHGNIIPGLEAALEGRQVGEDLSLEIAAADGYGARDPERVVEVGRDRLDFEPEVGSVVAAQLPDGRVQHLMVAGVEGDTVTLDGNHPLAGEDLHFEITVASVRPATAEEIAAGSVE
jgi:FKBP-type peptidyl-prolyl cis-trans isomerase SlyD